MGHVLAWGTVAAWPVAACGIAESGGEGGAAGHAFLRLLDGKPNITFMLDKLLAGPLPGINPPLDPVRHDVLIYGLLNDGIAFNAVIPASTDVL